MTRLILAFTLILPATATKPRLSQIERGTVASLYPQRFVDLDGDGDLDVFSGHVRSIFINRGWFENLGDGRFSPPKTIGFGDTRGTDYLMQLDDSPKVEVINIRFNETNERFEILHITPFNKLAVSTPRIIDSSTATNLIAAPLEDDFSPQFLEFTHDGKKTVHLKFKTLNSELLLEPWSSQTISIRNSLDLRDWHRSAELHVLDLDNDEDRDLVIGFRDQTFILERIGPNTFADTPLFFEGSFQTFADFDNNGIVELYNGNDGRSYLEHHGGEGFILTPNAPDPPRIPGRIPHPTSGGFPNFTSEIELEYEGAGSSYTINEFSKDANGEFTLSFSQTFPPELFKGFNGSGRGPIHMHSDIDGDGVLDLIVITLRPFARSARGEAQSVFVFKRNPDDYTLITDPPDFHHLLNRVVVSGDFDEDGDPDLLVGPDGSGAVALFANDGTGNFSESPNRINLMPDNLDRKIYGVYRLSVADFNEDGHEDLVIRYEVEERTENYEVAAAFALVFGNGDGSFTEASLAAEAFSTTLHYGISAIVDWDQDGDLDAVIDGGWLENIDGVLSNTKIPLLQNATTTDALGQPITLPGSAVGDIDGDGYPDFIALAYEFEGDDPANQIPPSKLAVGFNDGSGGIDTISTFTANLTVRDALGNPITYGLYVADLNLDGKDDFFTYNWRRDSFGNPLIESLNLVTPDPENPRNLEASQVEIIDRTFPPGSKLLNDFDGDGTLEFGQRDHAVTPTTQGPVFGQEFDFIQAGFPSELQDGFFATRALDDFDGDGDLDSIRLGTRGDTEDRLVLVRNLIIDERSSITADLIALGQPAILATPEADPDNDGLDNATEYLLGTDPLVPDADLARDLTPQWSPDQKSLTFPRRKDRENHALFYDLQASDDLLSWSRISQANATITDDGTDWELVTVTIPERENTRFFRVSASHDPGR